MPLPRSFFVSAAFVTMLFFPTAISPVNAQGGNTVDLVLFYGQGCPHCAGMIGFLEEMESVYPLLTVHQYEVYSHAENIPLFQKLAEAYGEGIDGVPMAFIGEKSFVGFSNQIGDQIKSEIGSCVREGCLSPLRHLEQPEEEIPVSKKEEVPMLPLEGEVKGQADPEEEKIPVVVVPSVMAEQEENGNSSANEARQDVPTQEEHLDEDLASVITIPAVIGAAVVDAVNPCEFAVLIILMTTVLATGKKRRALFSGLAFSLSIFISYFLMGLGLYSAIQAAGLTRTFYAVIAVLAVFIGLFNLKDYLWYGKWFLMEVPMSWRPRLKSLIRNVTSVPGAFFTGFAVSLFLLPCTSGPYIVILGLLAQTTTKGYALVLLVLYNLIFVSPMVLITGAVYFGFTTTEKAEECRTKCLKTLHLIAGLIILGLGIVMLGSLWLGYI